MVFASFCHFKLYYVDVDTKQMQNNAVLLFMEQSAQLCDNS